MMFLTVIATAMNNIVIWFSERKKNEKERLTGFVYPSFCVLCVNELHCVKYTETQTLLY